MATYAFTIAGVTKELRNGFTIRMTANGRALFEGLVYSADGTYRPAIGDEIVLTEDGTTIFGGYIDAPAEAGVGGIPMVGIETRISAVDYNSLAARRYADVTLAAGTLKSMLTTLVSTYLAANGVTLDAAQVDGPTLAATPFSFKRIDEILDSLTALSGGYL